MIILITSRLIVASSPQSLLIMDCLILLIIGTSILTKFSNLKKQVYALQFEEWKKDKIWEYLNDYEEYEELLKFV